jgi:diacylglycerol kinase (ATP)
MNPGKTSILFIINPISGRKTKDLIVAGITRQFDVKDFACSIVETTHRGNATELAEQHLDSMDIIVAVGGDGTINEIAKVLTGTKVALGIIPAGSGNGFARHFKIPLSFRKAIELIKTGCRIKADVGLVNDAPFFCTSGIGIDAETGHYFDQLDNRGLLSYAKSLSNLFFNYRPQKYKLLADGEEHRFMAYSIVVANISQYGYNFKIAPGASIVDGLLDVVVIREFPRLMVPIVAARSYFGTIDRSRYIWHKQVSTLRIEPAEGRNMIHKDGEPESVEGVLNYTVRPGVLNVIIDKEIRDKNDDYS